jgi:2-polyprenyl-3-methyl-5-hydroxy-6-metoxy-1,4-benzoquinol methylase
MNKVARRPFYADYAWAFDLLVDRPVHKECAVIATWLIDRGVLPGSDILDAGCGTGRYAIELARRGYVLHGVDLSPDLIDVATRTVGDSTGRVSFYMGTSSTCRPPDMLRSCAVASSMTSSTTPVVTPSSQRLRGRCNPVAC